MALRHRGGADIVFSGLRRFPQTGGVVTRPPEQFWPCAESCGNRPLALHIGFPQGGSGGASGEVVSTVDVKKGETHRIELALDGGDLGNLPVDCGCGLLVGLAGPVHSGSSLWRGRPWPVSLFMGVLVRIYGKVIAENCDSQICIAKICATAHGRII